MFQKDYRTHTKRSDVQKSLNDDLFRKPSEYSIQSGFEKISANKSNIVKLKQSTLRYVFKQQSAQQNQQRIFPSVNIQAKTDQKHNYLFDKKCNPNRIRAYNNISYGEKSTKLCFSTQKDRNIQTTDVDSNKFKNSLVIKSPTNVFQIAQKTSLSLGIVQNLPRNSKTSDTQLPRDQQPQFIINKPLKISYLHKNKTPSSFIYNQKHGYFKKKVGLEQLKPFTMQANLNMSQQLDKLTLNKNQSKQIQFNVKQSINNNQLVLDQKISNSEVKKKVLDTIFWFAESFKGRRPYNQDRYICLTNKQVNLRERFTKMVNKSIDGGSILNDSQGKDLSSKYWLFGVFDGHGGSKCSEFIKQNFYSNLNSNRNLLTDTQLALKQTFLKMQQKFLSLSEKSDSLQTSGSCAVVCLVKDSKLYFGNVGDSRALLLGESSVHQVTNDHKPDERQQKMRIIRNGGKLYKDGSSIRVPGKQNIKVFHQSRIMPGSLNVSRTIGDIEVKYKKYGGAPGMVIANPDIFVQPINKQYDHILLASDGLFQGLTNKQIHQIYKQILKTQSLNKSTDEQNKNQKLFVKQLIKKAFEKSNDNITIVCAKLT